MDRGLVYAKDFCKPVVVLFLLEGGGAPPLLRYFKDFNETQAATLHWTYLLEKDNSESLDHVVDEIERVRSKLSCKEIVILAISEKSYVTLSGVEVMASSELIKTPAVGMVSQMVQHFLNVNVHRIEMADMPAKVAERLVDGISMLAINFPKNFVKQFQPLDVDQENELQRTMRNIVSALSGFLKS